MKKLLVLCLVVCSVMHLSICMAKQEIEDNAEVAIVAHGSATKYKTAYKNIKHSQILKNLIEDVGIKDTIALTKLAAVSETILKDYIIPALEKIESGDFKSWRDNVLEKCSLEKLIEILNAANYFDIQKLFDSACFFVGQKLVKLPLDQLPLQKLPMAIQKKIALAMMPWVKVTTRNVVDATVKSMALSSDGSTLGTIEERMFYGNKESWVTVRTVFGGHVDEKKFSGDVCALSFNHDGTRLAVGVKSGNQSSVVIGVLTCAKFKLAISKELGLPSISDSEISCVCFNHDGSLVAAGSFDGFVRVWDVATKNERMSVRAHDKGVWSLCFGHNGNMLASGGADDCVKLWSLEKKELSKTFSCPSHKSQMLHFSDDDKSLVSASKSDGKMLWFSVNDMSTNPIKKLSIQYPHAVSDNGSCVVGKIADDVVLYDVDGERVCVKFHQKHDAVAAACFSSDGYTMACERLQNGSVFIDVWQKVVDIVLGGGGADAIKKAWLFCNIINSRKTSTQKYIIDLDTPIGEIFKSLPSKAYDVLWDICKLKVNETIYDLSSYVNVCWVASGDQVEALVRVLNSKHAYSIEKDLWDVLYAFSNEANKLIFEKSDLVSDHSSVSKKDQAEFLLNIFSNASASDTPGGETYKIDCDGRSGEFFDALSDAGRDKIRNYCKFLNIHHADYMQMREDGGLVYNAIRDRLEAFKEKVISLSSSAKKKVMLFISSWLGKKDEGKK